MRIVRAGLIATMLVLAAPPIGARAEDKPKTAEPEKAKLMTLEQLLSHTSGLEYDDRPLGGPTGEDPRVKLSTLHDRFIYQGTLNEKYKHEYSDKTFFSGPLKSFCKVKICVINLPLYPSEPIILMIGPSMLRYK